MFTLFASLATNAGLANLAISRGVFLGQAYGPVRAFLACASEASSHAAMARRPHCCNISVRSFMSSEDNCIATSPGGTSCCFGTAFLGLPSARSWPPLLLHGQRARILPPGGVVPRTSALWLWLCAFLPWLNRVSPPGCEGLSVQLGAVLTDFLGPLGEGRLCPWQPTISRLTPLSFAGHSFLPWRFRLGRFRLLQLRHRRFPRKHQTMIHPHQFSRWPGQCSSVRGWFWRHSPGEACSHTNGKPLWLSNCVFGHFGHFTSSVVGSALSSSGFQVGTLSFPGGSFDSLALSLGGFALSLPLAPRGRPGAYGLGQLRD